MPGKALRAARPSTGVVVADAMPTKEIFIDYLTKDIQLDDAILDLVDNSIDGARRSRAKVKGPARFEGLEVTVTFSRSGFRIEDNCGGIPLSLAKEYAFRFGRPSTAKPTPDSIGQFGVGMKRALFKIGRECRVESRCLDSDGFELSIDIDTWRESPDWSFELSVTPPQSNAARCGTTIEVSKPYDNVAESLSRDSFRSALALKIEARHQQTLNEGLAIRVNAVPVGLREIELLEGNGLSSGYEEATLYGDTTAPLTARIYCGLGPPKRPRDGGWYVYCNGRLVVGPDQTSLTGWGTDDGARIPRFHNQFGQFRGYAFLESTDPTHLPWTTTKAGLDTDHTAYRWLLQKMIINTRPVIDFLNDLDNEKNSDNPPKRSTLEKAISGAKLTSVMSITTARQFTAPKPKARATRADEQNVLYRRPTAQINAVKRVLGVKSNEAVGEGTFDYFYKREVRPK